MSVGHGRDESRSTDDVVLVEAVPDLEEEAGKVFFGDGHAVDADALTYSDEMRRRVESCGGT